MSFGPCVTLLVSSSGMTFFKTCIQRFSPNTLTGFLLCSKSNRRCFQVHVPLPLPKQLVIFGLGEWKCSETAISVEVLVSAEVRPQKIGTLTRQSRYVEERYLVLYNKQTNKQPLNWLTYLDIQVPDLGGRLEQSYCHRGSREGQERSLWQDCTHSVWGGRTLPAHKC